ncbi:hypothetical protein CAEBREN_17770 [Caenorhabditis brenneri]|uniref:Uncharacterized protein n=1 Tax=Caenorhabditis brenneri TaxID=135651 RepID=G0PB05_CAEBE|nr:hypothetical protein CAEBREN_17770 [Caenorhabditis brenneri]
MKLKTIPMKDISTSSNESSFAVSPKESHPEIVWNDLDNCFEIFLRDIPFPLKLYIDKISAGIPHITFKHWRGLAYMTFTEEDEALFMDGGKREKKKEDNLFTAEDKLYLEKIIKENLSRFKEIGYEIAKFVTRIHNIYDVCIFVTFDDRSIQLFYKNCQCTKANPKKETLWKVVLADGLHSFPKGTIITKHKIYLECFKNDPERWINMGTGRIQSTNIENINESGVYYHYGRVASKNETFEEMLWKELEKTPKMRKS